MTREKIFFISLALFTSALFAQTNVRTTPSMDEIAPSDDAPASEQTANSPTETETSSSTESSSMESEAVEEDAPVPYPQASLRPPSEEKKSVKEEKKKKTSKKPPQKYGDCTGESWIAQRIVTKRHAGWGWLKRDGESWKRAKWIMLEEKPDIIKAPQRFYNRPEDDNNMQYRLYGHFASYKGYEPNIDSLVDVFTLEGFEVIGPGPKIDRDPPGPSGSRKGRISERGPFL